MLLSTKLGLYWGVHLLNGHVAILSWGHLGPEDVSRL